VVSASHKSSQNRVDRTWDVYWKAEEGIIVPVHKLEPVHHVVDALGKDAASYNIAYHGRVAITAKVHCGVECIG
jgi:hypothetical protein